MNIVVVLRQVPDLIEPLEIDSWGAAFDLSSASFLVNECDDHALEQALLLKEGGEGTVTVVALDFGEPDNSLYAAAAKGADRIVKISLDADAAPSPRATAMMYAEAIKPLSADLVLVGVQAHDELDGVLAPMLAAGLALPYVGVIRGVKPVAPGTVSACKEFPGAVMARMTIRLPAVLGILAADQPPRYVPVSRIRAAMKTAQVDKREIELPEMALGVSVCKLFAPTAASRAQMLTGSETEVAARIAEILAEKGLLK
jgi:electron transfer flavoprotein beta subunit